MPSRSKEIEVGQRIAAWRRERGLSQGVVSRKAGIHPSYLSRIENGRVHPTVATAMRIARAMRVTPNELLGTAQPKREDRPCMVSLNGACLVDLIDTHGDAGAIDGPEKYTPQQIRLLRRFLVLLRQSSPKMLGALESVIGEVLEGRRPTPNA